MYAKSEKEGLSGAEKREIRKLVAAPTFPEVFQTIGGPMFLAYRSRQLLLKRGVPIPPQGERATIMPSAGSSFRDPRFLVLHQHS
jgi:hypothetical protein